ncbi:MAG: DUF484 family protein [Gammaproteobacteria bacterium]|jgi:uncharacterized protein|nr:DUF484 family protein [Gammaproteobacteria bacterium]MBT7306728.1 DUF484 family protein [Gammaproteobacteria bacterium]
MSQQSAKESELSGMGAAEVAAYLKANPGFFLDHLELLSELEVPHQSGGAVSLIERQIQILRQQNGTLQNEIRNLLHVARENNTLSENMHKLSLELMECEDRDDVTAALYDSLRDHFGIEQVVILLPHGETEESHEAFEDLMRDSTPFCGQLEESQRHTLFGEEIEQGASVALLPLGEFGGQGLVALGSSDPQQYHDKMGTHFLLQLAALVGRALQHCGK